MPKKREKFRNQYNYDFKVDTLFEKSPGPSMTVPDQSYSIPELIDKFQSGIPVQVERYGQYDEEPDHEDHDKRELLNMDLADQAEILQQQKELLQAVENKVEENKKAKEAKNELNEKRTEQETSKDTLQTSSIKEEKKQEEK